MEKNFIPESKKQDMLKFIRTKIIEPKRKKRLTFLVHVFVRLNTYKKYCDEHNYRIFIDKLWVDYQKIENKV